MGGTQRLAAVAAISHGRNYYNRTQTDTEHHEPAHFNLNVFFASATLCGVMLAVCVACWRRAETKHEREFDARHSDIYTISADMAHSLQSESMGAVAGPPPAYDAVVDIPPDPIKATDDCTLENVVTEPCPRCQTTSAFVPPVEAAPRPDSGLPSYEAAVLLRDTKL